MKAIYDFTRIGSKLKAAFVLLLFLASVFQLKAQSLVTNPADGHYCITSATGVTISVSNGDLVTYELWKNGVATGDTIHGAPGTVRQFRNHAEPWLLDTWKYGVYTTVPPLTATPTSVIIYEDMVPTAPTGYTASPTSVCTNGTSQLTAIGGLGTTFKWYTGSCGGTEVGTGTTWTTGTLTTTTTFYGRWENVSCFSDCIAVTIYVDDNNPPVISNVSPATTVCSGTQVTLTGSIPSGGGTLYWYDGTCGTTGELATGTLITTPSPTTTYYLRKYNACGWSQTCVSQTITVIQPQTPPTNLNATPSTSCSGGTVTITATVGCGGGTLTWYTNSCPGAPGTVSPTGTGTTLVVSPTSTTIYYGRMESGSCYSECASITVTVIQPTTPPSNISTNQTSYCSGQEIILTLNGGSGTQVGWYTTDCGVGAASGGTASGTTYRVIKDVGATTDFTYWARWEASPCTPSSCVSTTITVWYVTDPTSGSAASETICTGNSTTLSAVGGTGQTFKWYKGTCGGTLVGTGTSTVSTGILTQTTSFYGRWEAPYCNSNCVTVTVTVISPPATPDAINATLNPVCYGSSTVLTVTGGGGGGVEPTLNWYSGFNPCTDPDKTTFVGTGPSLTVTPSVSTIYYARYSNICGNSGCVSITLCVDYPATGPTGASANPNPICNGTVTTLTATGDPGTYPNPIWPACTNCSPTISVSAVLNWYSSCVGGTLLGTGTPLLVSPPTTTTYYAVWENACGRSSCASVTVIVNKVTNPTGITPLNPVICKGNETTLTVNFPLAPLYEGTIKWYSSTTPVACGGGTLMTQTSTSITVSPTVTTYYYARTENSYGGLTCVSNCVSSTVTVLNPMTPVPITTPATLICCSNNTITLTATRPTGSTGTIHWYVGSCADGTTSGVATGTTYTVTVPCSGSQTSTTYYAKMIDGACYSSCASITITVDPVNTPPSEISATHNPVCAGTSTTLSVTYTGPGVLHWYTGSSGCDGELITEGTNSITVTPTITSRYFVRAEGGVCPPSDCKSITITISGLPQTPTQISGPQTVCIGTQPVLTATYTEGLNVTLEWYENDCGSPGTHIGTGSPLTVSPTPTVGTHTYYARTENTDCTTYSSACLTTTVLVKALTETPTAVTATPSVICLGSSTTLSAYASVGALVWYETTCGGTPIDIGLSITVTPTTSGLKTYWVKDVNLPCPGSACVSVTVLVKDYPVAPSEIQASANPICLGTAITLTAVGAANGTIEWYSGSTPCSGPLIAEGVSSIVVTPTITTWYYARTSDPDCGVSGCTSKLITVNNPPTAPSGASATPSFYCTPGSSVLSVTGGSGTALAWYSNAACTVPAVGTWSGTTFIVSPSVKGTYKYYARYETPPCPASASVTTQVDVLDKDVVPIITSSPVTICSTSTGTTITASQPTGNTGTLKWYKGDGHCGNALYQVATGTTSYATGTLTQTTRFYVLSENGCGKSPCADIWITVHTPPAAPTVTPSQPIVCSGNTITLTATGGDGGGGSPVLKWFAGGSCSGIPIITGPTQITVTPTTSSLHSNEVIYYSARYDNVCVGVCTQTSVIVVPRNTPPTISSSANPSCAGYSITLTATGGTGNILKWYTGSEECGGCCPIATGTTEITVAPTMTSRYFARYESESVYGCAPSACASITVDVSDIPQTPTSISGPVTVCEGSTVVLNATYIPGHNIKLKWYKETCGGTINYLGEDGTLTISPATSTMTYFARTEAAPCDPSECLSVTVTVIPKPVKPTGVTTNTSICYGQTIELHASTTVGTLTWYKGTTCGVGDVLGTGSTLPVSPTENTTYWVRSENPPCDPSACVSVTVTVKPLPVAPTHITASKNPICNGEMVTLTAQGGSGTAVRWYVESCGGIFLCEGNPFTATPTITTKYYARWYNDCGNSECASLTVTVYPQPVAPTSITPGTSILCTPANVTLTANNGSGTELKWYTESCSGTYIGSGNPLILTNVPIGVNRYYAKWTNPACESTCAVATVTVYQSTTNPDYASANPNKVCSGTPSYLTLSGGTGAVAKWYTGNCGGEGSVFVGQGTTISVTKTVTDVVQVTYYARWENVICYSNCVTTTVTFYPLPGTPTNLTKSPTTAVCPQTAVTLSVTPNTAAGATLRWYAGGCGPEAGGTLINTGSPTIIVNPLHTTTYYVRNESDGGCNSGCLSITVNVTELPSSDFTITATADPVCYGSSTTLTVVGGGGPGAWVEWFSGSSGCNGPLFAVGVMSITVEPHDVPITNYWARWTNVCGSSDCKNKPIHVVIAPVAPASITVTAGSNPMCGGNSITLHANLAGLPDDYTTIKWSKTGCHGTVISTGADYTLTLTQTTTFNVWTENACGQSNCASLEVVVYYVTNPTEAYAVPNPICQGATTKLHLHGGSGNSIKWYTGSCGGTYVGTGDELQVSPTTTTVYYGRYESGFCYSNCLAVTVTVYTAVQAPNSATATPDALCEGLTVTLSAEGGGGGILKWYDGDCGGTIVATGNDQVVTPTVGTHQYYARYQNGECLSNCVTTTIVIVYEEPVAPTGATADDYSICVGETTTIHAANGSGWILQWYADQCGGTPIGNGFSLNVSPTVTTTYYARWETPVCDPSACVSVTVTVYDVPVAPESASADPNPVQLGSSTILHAEGGSGDVLKWYETSCGGTYLGMNNDLVVTPTAGTHVYWARYESNHGCGSSGCVSVTVVVQTLTLSGVVQYDNPYLTPLNNVYIYLYKDGIYTGMSTYTATDIIGGVPVQGHYQFTGLVPGNYSYEVLYYGTWGGVNATDALKIELFASDSTDYPIVGLAHTAGDVDLNLTVNGTDALWVKMRTVSLVTYFPAGDWVFDNVPFTLTGNWTYNFMGLCTGDVNQSFIPIGLKSQSFISVVDDGTRYISTGQVFDYEIKPSVSREIGAMTLFLGYDQNLVDIQGVKSNIGEMQYNVLADGQIGLAWSAVQPVTTNENEPIFTFQMKAKDFIAEPVHVFTIEGGSEFANATAERISDLNLKMTKLASLSNSFSISNYPNPFQNNTTIVYTLPEQGHVRLTLTNIYGQPLRTLVNADQTPGIYRITVDPAEVNLQPGVYMYQIEVNGVTTNFSQVNKMIFTR